MPATKHHYRRSAIRSILLAFLLFFLPGVCMAGDLSEASKLIVFEASGAAFKPGDRVDPSASLALAVSQKLILIAPDGKVLTVSGPYSGPIPDGVANKIIAVSDVFGDFVRDPWFARRVPPGVIRGEIYVQEDDPWVIDASEDSIVCIHLAVEYDIWRHDDSGPAIFRLSEIDGTPQQVDIAFASGRMKADVPDSYIFRDLTKYTITGPTRTVVFLVHTVPESVPTNSKVTAVWFILAHCNTQARALVSLLMTSCEINNPVC